MTKSWGRAISSLIEFYNGFVTSSILCVVRLLNLVLGIFVKFTIFVHKVLTIVFHTSS